MGPTKKNDAPSNDANFDIKETLVLKLLDRPAEQSYINEWTDVLSKPFVPQKKTGRSVLVFKLGTEWLAIDSSVLLEVLPYKKVHRVPHRTDDVLKGIINYQGLLTLCVNFHAFLQVECQVADQKKDTGALRFHRMIAIQKEQDIWIFGVDAIFGTFTVDPAQIENVPVTLSKTATNYLRGVFFWNEVHVGYIDDELLFFGLARRLL